MEGNRDEADRCIDIAKAALRDSQIDKAEKFLQKAETLYPTAQAKALLASVQLAKSQAKSAASAGESGQKQQEREPTTSAPRRRASPGRAEPEYTAGQLELVKKIKK